MMPRKVVLLGFNYLMCHHQIKLQKDLDSVDGLEVRSVLLIMQRGFMCSRKDGGCIMGRWIKRKELIHYLMIIFTRAYL